ncbi:MAG: ribosomal subunit interface protein [Planctomycetales bacterium 4572_13]|nr:MAG: ribosomal subunit interface protein [Planctomycetales bacterium 4572_13]
MIVTITGKHIEVTDAIRAHAEEKVEKLPRYYDSITQIEVVLEGNNSGMQGVEILVHAEHNDLLIAKETGTDTYACIDVAAHKMERQLRRAKEKQRSHKAASASEVADIEIASQLPEEGVA